MGYGPRDNNIRYVMVCHTKSVRLKTDKSAFSDLQTHTRGGYVLYVALPCDAIKLVRNTANYAQVLMADGWSLH